MKNDHLEATTETFKCIYYDFIHESTVVALTYASFFKKVNEYYSLFKEN